MTDLPDIGVFEARYLAFLATIAELRPSLHRYCARMTGSVSDGEDIVQEALFHAYRRLDTFDDTRPLKPWLFQIAHHRCIDFLRRRDVRENAETEAEAETPDVVTPAAPVGAELGRAVEFLVLTLPPKERASVLLKDVLDYSLEEIAELIGTTVGGVKAALNRGRTKLAASPEKTPPRRAINAEAARLRNLYVERFNRRDWNGLRELIADDARVLVADRFAGRIADSPYFGRYQRLTIAWRMADGEVDGEPVVISMHEVDGVWTPHSIIRLYAVGDRIARIVDYDHCGWVLPAAASVLIQGEVT